MREMPVENEMWTPSKKSYDYKLSSDGLFLCFCVKFVTVGFSNNELKKITGKNSQKKMLQYCLRKLFIINLGTYIYRYNS